MRLVNLQLITMVNKSAQKCRSIFQNGKIHSKPLLRNQNPFLVDPNLTKAFFFTFFISSTCCIFPRNAIQSIIVCMCVRCLLSSLSNWNYAHKPTKIKGQKCIQEMILLKCDTFGKEIGIEPLIEIGNTLLLLCESIYIYTYIHL